MNAQDLARELLFLLLAIPVIYTLGFGIQNKATFLHERSAFTDALISCSFCLGFHCGWLSLLGTLLVRNLPSWQYGLAAGVLWSCWGAFVYFGLDALIGAAERHAQPPAPLKPAAVLPRIP